MSAPLSLSVATYNILNPYHAVKWAEQAGLSEAGRALSSAELKASTTAADENAWRPYSNWRERGPKVAENIGLADIVCLQEVSKETLANLLEGTRSKGYQLAGVVYHASSQPIQEFGNAILYRADKMECLTSFNIDFFNGEWVRSASCASFQVMEKTVVVASVHLAGYYPQETNFQRKQASKKSGYEELKTYMENLMSFDGAAQALIIAGDFNEDPNESAFDLYRPGLLLSQGFRFDGNLAVTEPLKNRRIDWLCYKPLGSSEAAELKSMGLEASQNSASDHLMTGTVLTWPVASTSV